MYKVINGNTKEVVATCTQRKLATIICAILEPEHLEGERYGLIYYITED